MLTKHEVSQVLSLNFNKALVYCNWNFPIYWSALLTLTEILRELDQVNDVTFP